MTDQPKTELELFQAEWNSRGAVLIGNVILTKVHYQNTEDFRRRAYRLMRQRRLPKEVHG